MTITLLGVEPASVTWRGQIGKKKKKKKKKKKSWAKIIKKKIRNKFLIFNFFFWGEPWGLGARPCNRISIGVELVSYYHKYFCNFTPYEITKIP
jgi:hypothetical protein